MKKILLSLQIFITICSFSFAAQIESSTYLGGSDADYNRGIVVDALGVSVTGFNNSANFPITSGSYSNSLSGSYDIYVTKFDTTLSNLVFSTFIGGTENDRAYTMCNDSGGNYYLSGYTNSNNFPTLNSFDNSFNGGSYDCYLTKLNSSGDALYFSTYLGGSGDEIGRGITIDLVENVILTGRTGSSDFPTTTNAYDNSYNGSGDAFLAQFNSLGNLLDYSTFIGGSSDESGESISIDTNTGEVFISGYTESSNFPTTLSSFDNSINGDYDCFITKLVPSANFFDISYSTFLGGSSEELSRGITIDSNGSACITGATYSTNYPMTSGAFDVVYDDLSGNSGDWLGGEAIVSKLDPSGAFPLFSTFVGGDMIEGGIGIDVDSNNNVYVVGRTTSFDFPLVNQVDNGIGGGDEGMVFMLSALGDSLLFSSYLGGEIQEYVYSVKVDENENIFIAGDTNSNFFPTTPNAFSNVNSYGNEVFVSKVKIDIGSSLNPNLQTMYSTYLGGGDADYNRGIVVDALGVSVTGFNNSANFPITSGSYSNSLSGSYDIYVTKFDTTLSNLVFSTFIGGTENDRAYTMCNDSGGNYYLSGYTNSNNFPTLNSFDNSFNGGSYDCYLTKLNSSGDALYFSTYLGGSGDEIGRGITIDLVENVILTGRTGSSDFPTTTNAYDNSYNGSGDAFLAQFNSLGNLLDYSTFIGGSSDESGESISIDTNTGEVFISGYTESSNFPTTLSSFDNSINGDYDCFITKLVPSANFFDISYSTFLGGSSEELSRGITIDSNGSACITGATYSTNYPMTSGAFDVVYDDLSGNSGDWLGGEAIVSKLDPSGAFPLFSTFVGGDMIEGGIGIDVDSNNNVYVVGRTTSFDFPLVNQVDNGIGGGDEGMVFMLSALGDSLLFSSYLGGEIQEYVYSVKVDENENIFIAGDTNSNFFPTTPNAFSNVNSYGNEVFVSRINGLSNSNSLAPISDLKISADGNNIILSWPSVLNANSYKIYRSSFPNSQGNEIGVVSASSSPSYTDSGILNSNTKYFYSVTWEN